MLRTRKANSSIGCLGLTRRCGMMRRANNLAPMAPPLIKRQPLAHFISRKSPTLIVSPELATFRRDNSILNLSTAPTAHLESLHSRRSEILVLLMQLARRAVPAMPLNPTKRSPAVLTRRTGPSSKRVKVKSRLTGRMRRSRSNRCASC